MVGAHLAVAVDVDEAHWTRRLNAVAFEECVAWETLLADFLVVTGLAVRGTGETFGSVGVGDFVEADWTYVDTSVGVHEFVGQFAVSAVFEVVRETVETAFLCAFSADVAGR